MHVDVFNGDADGIIALVQLRLAEPKKSQLVTGVKRDIQLLRKIAIEKTDSLTVLDISMEKNIEPLHAILANEIPVFYVDHHRAGAIPSDSNLTTLIDADPNTCTSLLVNEYLNHKFVNWAVAAAYGDNMTKSAELLADKAELSQEQREKLCALGVYVNYNGYGRTESDLHYHPAALYELLVQYEDPLVLIEQDESIFNELQVAYNSDMAKAESANVLIDNDICKVVMLANEAWARRVSGVFGNELANTSPSKAHAVLTENEDKTYTVSVRAPLNNKQGADEVCIRFPTGGGRSAAAGINQLPNDNINSFIETLMAYYQ